jgi:hypothetical protein
MLVVVVVEIIFGLADYFTAAVVLFFSNEVVTKII